MKKQKQLGMNPGTASGRLVKDLLFKFVQEQHPNCYRCNKPLTRETFSIEHKTPWLDSDDPVGLYFDLDNIDFSHRSCNTSAARRPNKVYTSTDDKLVARSSRARDKWRALSKEEQQAIRRDKYLRYGK